MSHNFSQRHGFDRKSYFIKNCQFLKKNSETLFQSVFLYCPTILQKSNNFLLKLEFGWKKFGIQNAIFYYIYNVGLIVNCKELKSEGLGY